MKNKIQLIAALLLSVNSWGQDWHTNGLNIGGFGNDFGTSDNTPIDIFTNGIQDLNPYAVFSCYCSPPKSSTFAH